MVASEEGLVEVEVGQVAVEVVHPGVEDLEMECEEEVAEEE